MRLIRAILQYFQERWPGSPPQAKNFGTADPDEEKERDRRFLSSL